jgi:serine acetyltransferase
MVCSIVGLASLVLDDLDGREPVANVPARVISNKNPKTTACKILKTRGGGMNRHVVKSEGGW